MTTRRWQLPAACINVHRTVPRLGLIFAGVFLVASLASRPAAAQTGGSGVITGVGGGTGTQFDPADFFIGVQHEQGSNLRDFEVKRFFNKANCDCSEPVFLYFALQPTGVQKRSLVNRNGNVEIWIGSNCSDVSSVSRAARCKQLKTQLLSAFLNVGNDSVMTNARVMSTETNVSTITGVFPNEGNPTCTLGTDSGSMGVFLLIDNNGDGYPEVTASNSVYIDLKAPPSPDPDGITVEGGDQALVVRWPKVDSSLYTDLLGYQVLCNRAGSLQVFANGTFDPGFASCSATSGDGGVESLNPLYACSPLLSLQTSSYRIKILQNDIVYGATVVSVDQSRNASPPDIFYGTPVATKSFYEVYRNGHEGATEPDGSVPGGATGGFCAVSEPAPGRRTLWLATAGFAVVGLLIAARKRGRR
jgi:hypothetical protein